MQDPDQVHDTVQPVAKDRKGKETIADRIHHAMRLRGLGYNELDRLLGRSEGYTSRLIKEHRTPRADTVREISAKLSVSAHWLLTGDPGRAPQDGFIQPAEEAVEPDDGLRAIERLVRHAPTISAGLPRTIVAGDFEVTDDEGKPVGTYAKIMEERRRKRVPLEARENPPEKFLGTLSEPRYPELELALAFFGDDHWTPEAVAAARAMRLDADEAPSPKWWAAQLDRIDAALRSAKLEIGDPIEGDPIHEARGPRGSGKTRR